MGRVRYQASNNVSAKSLKKEATVREWIARKESVCPYAPGLAQFFHVPNIDPLSMDAVYLFAQALKGFYSAKENGKPIGRWMLTPTQDWQNQTDAFECAEYIFWGLNAAYYHLQDDKKNVEAALAKSLPGYVRGHQGEIINPVVGKLPNPASKRLPPKSLFCTALSPLYRSRQFYRYCPHSIMPLVYVSEFNDMKRTHPKASQSITFDMACKGLFEVFGDDLTLDVDAFKSEFPIWGGIVDMVADSVRKSPQVVCSGIKEDVSQSQSNLRYFKLAEPEWVDMQCQLYMEKLRILEQLSMHTGASLKEIIGASFCGSGLYVLPSYPSLYSAQQR